MSDPISYEAMPTAPMIELTPPASPKPTIDVYTELDSQIHRHRERNKWCIYCVYLIVLLVISGVLLFYIQSISNGRKN